MNDRKEKNNSQGVTLSRKMLIAAIAVVLLLIAGGVAVGINWNHWFGEETPKTEEQKEAFQPDLDPDAENWTGEKIPDKSEEEAAGIKIPGYPSITIPADQQKVAVSLLNPAGNFQHHLIQKPARRRIPRNPAHHHRFSGRRQRHERRKRRDRADGAVEKEVQTR